MSAFSNCYDKRREFLESEDAAGDDVANGQLRHKSITTLMLMIIMTDTYKSHINSTKSIHNFVLILYREREDVSFYPSLSPSSILKSEANPAMTYLTHYTSRYDTNDDYSIFVSNPGWTVSKTAIKVEEASMTGWNWGQEK